MNIGGAFFMRNICLIDGSPKNKKSNSSFLLQKLGESFEESYHKYYFHIAFSAAPEKRNEIFTALDQADVIIFGFPLYVYSVPGLLMQFLEKYYQHYKMGNLTKRHVKVYIIINCAFPDPVINNEAIRVLKNFCNRLHLDWRFAVSIGSGALIDTIRKVKFLESTCENVYESLREIYIDIERNQNTVVETKYIVPKSTKLKNRSMDKSNWIKLAFKNGLLENDLYRRPYA